jgi:hypothetical protein
MKFPRSFPALSNSLKSISCAQAAPAGYSRFVAHRQINSVFYLPVKLSYRITNWQSLAQQTGSRARRGGLQPAFTTLAKFNAS